MSKNQQHGSAIHRLVGFLQRLEDGIMVTLLLTMIVLASAQVLLRNLGVGGLSWAEPLLRNLVLWVGLWGAMIATRQNRHISIDIASKYLKSKFKISTGVITDIFTLLVSGTIAWHAIRFVQSEMESGVIIAGVPVWLFESIIPVAFTVIALRYLLFSLGRLKNLKKGDNR